MKFSIITPVYLYNEWRRDMLNRAVMSVIGQTVKDWELIIVNDGSQVKFSYPKSDRIKVLTQPHLERLIAYNTALKEAKGDWIVFCDSDDEMVSYYLEACEAMIKKYPDYKMFNFGSIHIGVDYSARLRGTFKPKILKVGHEIFGGGNIVNGTFIFHRSVYEDLGAFPTTSSPWDFSTMAQEKFPELKAMFMVDHKDEPEKIVKELGNPWGQDFYLFYKYTRKYHSKPIDAHLYVVFPSRQKFKL